jgi:O-methyltransferase
VTKDDAASFRDGRVTVGRHTYGLKKSSFALYVPADRIEIGSFCSFAREVLLFGGGEHRVGASTFPLRARLVDPEGPNVEALSKGPLRIGNDCWFGARSIALSGVTVGHGAIVAAGAVVARDVPPYAVVAGNPAKVVRMRFDEGTVARLLAAAWWDWDDETIRERAHLFDDVERLLEVAEADPPRASRPSPPASPSPPPAATDRYLDLLGRAVLGELHRGDVRVAKPRKGGRVDVVTVPAGTPRDAAMGWPLDADTMLSAERLANVRACVESVLADDVPGDLIETGVWRGGATILMRGILAAHGVADRRVWVADSFQGLPPADAEAFPADAGSPFHEWDLLAVSEDEVRAAFARYGLLDEQVRFLPGWFRDTLPTLAHERFAVVRLDGDMYESTWVALDSLYPRLSVGGYLIVDDYAIRACRKAVADYRAREGIDEPIVRIDETGAYWRKVTERPAAGTRAG